MPPACPGFGRRGAWINRAETEYGRRPCRPDGHTPFWFGRLICLIARSQGRKGGSPPPASLAAPEEDWRSPRPRFAERPFRRPRGNWRSPQPRFAERPFRRPRGNWRSPQPRFAERPFRRPGGDWRSPRLRFAERPFRRPGGDWRSPRPRFAERPFRRPRGDACLCRGPVYGPTAPHLAL